MSAEGPEPDLSAAFAELRRRDAAGAPAFAPMWRPRARRASPLWIAVPAGTLVAAAAAVFVWIGASVLRHAEPHAPPAALQVTVEPDPLGFLLDDPTIARVPDFDSDPRRTP